MEKANLNWSDLTFAYMKTDCHLEYYYRNGKWGEGQIVNEDTIKLNIASTCLHYGQECFEGAKAFEDRDGNVRVFRIEENARRMIRSAEKIQMAPFPEDMFIDAVYKLVKLNKRFIPPFGSGASLYLRPLLLGITDLIGVRPSTDYVFLIFCSPVGPYFKSGFKPVKLIVEEEFDRAAPNGVGDVKVGGNYAAGMRATIRAKNAGYTEVLYLDAKHKEFIDESGPANFFGITYDNKYITPASDSVLPSITNMSLMKLAADMGMKVEKRPIHVNELAYLKEAGCCGTAAVITPVKSITFRDKVITYCETDEAGETSTTLYNNLKSIQSGLLEDKYGWTREIPLT